MSNDTEIDRIEFEMAAIEKKYKRAKQRLRELADEGNTLFRRRDRAILRSCIGQTFRVATSLESIPIGAEATLLNVMRTWCRVRFTGDDKDCDIPQSAIMVDREIRCLRSPTDLENRISATIGS
jgi:hypothetical protein